MLLLETVEALTGRFMYSVSRLSVGTPEVFQVGFTDCTAPAPVAGSTAVVKVLVKGVASELPHSSVNPPAGISTVYFVPLFSAPILKVMVRPSADHVWLPFCCKSCPA